MTKKLAVLGFLMLAFSASTAGAQRAVSRPIEIGIDGAVTIGFDDPNNVTVVRIPESFRVGFFMTPKVSIEPRVHFTSLSVGGGSNETYALELGALFHPGGYRTGSGIYIRPFVGVEDLIGSDSDAYLGAGLGVRTPFWDRRLAARLEGNFAHVFSPGGLNRLGILFGLSFFP